MKRAMKRLNRIIDFWLVVGVLTVLVGTLAGYLDHTFAYVSWCIAFLIFYLVRALIKIKEDIEYEVKTANGFRNFEPKFNISDINI